MPKWKLYERSRIYWVRFSIDGIDYRISTKQSDKGLANQRANQIVEEITRNLAKGPQQCMGHLCAAYLKHVKVFKKTWRDDMAMMKVIIEFFGAETPLHEIRQRKIEEFVQWLLQRKVGKVRHLSKQRANRYLAVLKTMFYRALDWEMIDGMNPVKRVKMFRENSRQRFFSQREISRMWHAAKEISDTGHTILQKRFIVIFTTSLLTGARLSEVLNLRWTDYRDDGFFQLQNTKNYEKRLMPIRRDLFELLNSLPRVNDFVFGLPKRDPSSIRKVWATVKANAEIEPSARFHDLRHTHATLLLQAGVDPRTAMSILGHKSMKVFEGYTHTTMELQLQAVNKIELPAPFQKKE